MLNVSPFPLRPALPQPFSSLTPRRRFTCLGAAVLVSSLLVVPIYAAAPPAGSVEAELTAGLKLRNIGPALMSGRIADIALHPERPSTWYVAAGSGGVFKTDNAGTTWTPIFDHEGSYSIGCLSLDPQNPETIWVGSGENVSGRHVGWGDGVYRSDDGGKSWARLGLETSEHIAKILIHPQDSDSVWVAAEGPLWSSGGERGVYHSADGGQTWQRVLDLGDDVGVTDLEMDPSNPDVLYAASYERRRHTWGFLAGGPGSGVHKSSDGGKTWRRLTGGLPSGDVGKIGLAVSPLNPSLIYATLEADDKDKGLYRSADGGASWEKRASYTSGGTGGHYYQELYASPHRLDHLYQMDVWLHISEDGGRTFRKLGGADKHSDNHALAFDSRDPDHLVVGTDGGIYETFDHGKTWRYVANLPLTQSYKLAVEPARGAAGGAADLFYDVLIGTQDNGTQVGPARTRNVHGIRNQDWSVPVSADGYDCAFDAELPHILYGEWQVGSLVRFDRRSGEQLFIQPQPAADEPAERWNWDSPLELDPHRPGTLYFGSHRLWRSDDRGSSWRPISQDLSRGTARYDMPFHDRVPSIDSLWDNNAMSYYATTTSITASPRVRDLIYVGTDDGLVQVTEDGGETWRRAAPFQGVPERVFVNELKASRHRDGRIYALLSAHKLGDFRPLLWRSDDRGTTWVSVAGDLPAKHVVWSLVEDPEQEDLLYLGTEYGLFVSLDGGSRWLPLKGGVPTIAFRDLEFQESADDLVAASFGRGVFVLDDVSPLRALAEATARDAFLFEVRDTPLYVPSVPLGVRDRAAQGSDYFLAPNPPHGAVFTYFLRDGIQSLKERRQEEEKPLEEKGADVPFPGWERLAEEARDPGTRLLLTVRDAAGRALRRLDAPTAKGLHRIEWDLRLAPPQPISLEPPGDYLPWELPPFGPLAGPGTYTVEAAWIKDGAVEPWGEPRTFEVTTLPDAVELDWPAVTDFQNRTLDLLRRALGAGAQLGEAGRRLAHLQAGVLQSPGTDLTRLGDLQALKDRLDKVALRLHGDSIRAGLSEPTRPSVIGRLFGIAYGHWQTTQGPTAVHHRDLAIASEQLESLLPELQQLVQKDLADLEDKAAATGMPWTPSRARPTTGDQ